MGFRPTIVLLSLLAACGDGPGRMLVDCYPSAELDVAERLARLDRDGDAEVTPADLLPGQALVLLDWIGDQGSTGTSVHYSDQVEIWYSPYSDWDPRWAVHLEFHDCEPSLGIGISFYGEDRIPTQLKPGEGEFGAYVSVQDLEVGPSDEGSLSRGVVRVTDVVPSTRASFQMIGYSEIELVSYLPPGPRTGQVVRVEAFVVRDAEIIGEPGL